MKKILALILTIAMCLALISCGQQSGQDKPSTTETPEAETAPVETEIHSGVDFVGMTVEQAEQILGRNYIVDSWQGADCLYYDDQPYILAVWLNYDETDNVPIHTKTISSVEVQDGGYVTDKITVGMTKGEIDAALGYTTEVYTSEGSNYQYGITLEIDGKTILLDLDNGMVTKWAMIKKSQ